MFAVINETKALQFLKDFPRGLVAEDLGNLRHNEPFQKSMAIFMLIFDLN